MQLGQQLIQQAHQQGQSFPDVNGDGIDDRLQDPNFLAQKTTQVHQQQPGLLGQLFGGGLAGGAGGGHIPGGGAPAGGGGTGGVGSDLGGMLSSPLAKGVLGGIAGAGLMRMLSGGHHYGGGGLFGAPTWVATLAAGHGGMDEMYEEGYEEGLEDAYGVTSGVVISEVTSENKAVPR